MCAFCLRWPRAKRREELFCTRNDQHVPLSYFHAFNHLYLWEQVGLPNAGPYISCTKKRCHHFWLIISVWSVRNCLCFVKRCTSAFSAFTNALRVLASIILEHGFLLCERITLVREWVPSNDPSPGYPLRRPPSCIWFPVSWPICCFVNHRLWEKKMHCSYPGHFWSG